jgi:hypothetical protein
MGSEYWSLLEFRSFVFLQRTLPMAREYVDTFADPGDGHQLLASSSKLQMLGLVCFVFFTKASKRCHSQILQDV